MAISKKDFRVQTPLGFLATPITYWAYAGVVEFKPGIPGVVVKFNGYTDAKARAAAKENGYLPDHYFEFLITDWQETIPHTRPATLEEKKNIAAVNPALTPLIVFTDEQRQELGDQYLESLEEDQRSQVTDKQLKGIVDGRIAEVIDERLNAQPYDILENEEVIQHKDYTNFMLNYGKDTEAAAVYEIMKTHQYSRDFFAGAKDI